MDSVQMIMEFGKNFGLTGAVLIIWWLSDRSHQRTLASYREDMTKLSQMYKDNAKLVEAHESLSRDLKDIIIMNTEAMTALVDSIKTNQYCPQVRLKKQAEGVQA